MAAFLTSVLSKKNSSRSVIEMERGSESGLAISQSLTRRGAAKFHGFSTHNCNGTSKLATLDGCYADIT